MSPRRTPTPAESAPPAPTPALPAAASALDLAIEAARILHDDKCTDVVVLDVRALSHVSDFVIIGSGTSDRQMRSAADDVEEMGETRGSRVFRRSVDDGSTWLLLDFVDVVVHLFEPNIRAHYDLEMLWGDAPRIAWERHDQIDRDRAGLNTGATSRARRVPRSDAAAE